MADKILKPGSFLTRNMLAFESGARFGIKIVSQSTSTSKLIIRGITSEGAFAFVHTPTSNSVIATETFFLPDIPIMVCVQDKDQALVQGDTYITLALTANGDTIQELCSGLVYRQKSISWPSTNSVDMRPGGGKIKVVTGSNPAGGTDVSDAVPAGQIWRLMSAILVLNTSAVVGTRRVQLGITTAAGDRIIRVMSEITQAENLSRNYYFETVRQPNTITGTDNTIVMPIPNPLILTAGMIIITQTDSMKAGDDYDPPTYLIEQFFNSA